MPHRPQPTFADIAQALGLLGQPPYVSALEAQHQAYARWWEAERARRLRDHGLVPPQEDARGQVV